MKDKLLKLIEKFNGLAIRLRLLFTFSAVVLTVLLFDALWFSDIAQEVKKLNRDILIVEQAIETTLLQQTQLNRSITDQRNHPIRKQLVAINRQISQAKQELQQRAVSLVPPENMAMVLKDIIDRSQSLKLISLAKQSPVPLFDNNKKQQIQMYRHPVTLVLEGSYTNTQKFLQELESMVQKIEFVELSYEVKTYPKSELSLTVSTISFDQGWIGG